jgi:threonine dehydratase
MIDSLKAGRLVDVIETPTLADALAGGLNQDNRYTFPLVQKYVDETAVVSEEEIAEGIVFCVREHKMVVEGGGVVGLSAVLAEKVKSLGENVAVVISGGNIAKDVLASLLSKS